MTLYLAQLVRKTKKVSKQLNCKGQVLIELLVIAPLFISLMILTTKYVYLSHANYWIRLSVYESTICLAKHKSQSSCKNELMAKINAGAPFGKLKYIKIKNNNKNYYSKVIWLYLKKSFTYSHRLEKYD